MGVFYNGFVIVLMAQLVLLLFSPRYHQRSRILHWYYTAIFKPLFSGSSSSSSSSSSTTTTRRTTATFYNSVFQKCKYYFVPIFYLFLYNYLAFYLFYYKLSQALVKIGLVGIIESQVFVPILLLVPLVSGVLCFWYSAKMSLFQKLDHSEITESPWPYDELIFYSTNNVCSTCETIKQPRSKHCSICNVCVSFQDHHCIWFNCCISGTNYKWFYMFLVSNWFILAYGALRLMYIKYGQTKIAIPQYYQNSVLTLIILCFCFVILLSWFLYTQWELIKEGMTTNECDKWYTVHQLIEDGLLVRSTKSNKYYELYNTNDHGKQNSFHGNNNNNDNNNDNNTKDVYGISLNPNDNSIYNLGQMFEIVQSPYEIINIYDKGSFWNNLKERLNC